MKIYKILQKEDWQNARRSGFFTGSAVDRTDGFIHFSTGEQVRETAARHFAGQSGLVLIAFESDAFGETLRWEPSRGGHLFPHLFAELDVRLALSVVDLVWDGKVHVFPAEVSA
jgi:uncharacterized protein (DUF952 family)